MAKHEGESLIVGCPVRKRDWVLRDWFSHADTSCKRAGFTPGYAFVVGEDDTESLDLIKHCTDILGREVSVLKVGEPKREDRRSWNRERYDHMASLRNQLFDLVKSFSPDLFLSLDSDILLHPDCVTNLHESMYHRGFDVVGGKTYMTPSGRSAPSYGNLNSQGNILRPDGDGVFRVDVVMAIKLMKRRALDFKYGVHKKGEDLYISEQWRNGGLKLGWDGRLTNKHMLNPSMMGVEDQRWPW